MQLINLHDKAIIERTLRRNTFLNLYTLGDLDDFFWPYTLWYGLEDGGTLHDAILLYTAPELPVLLAISEPHSQTMQALLRAALHLLPRAIYTHVTPDFLPILAQDYAVEPHGLHYKMALPDPSRVLAADTTHTVILNPADLPDLLRLYAASYPGNWFDPRMLETGQYVGLRLDGDLVGVAGIHVYSPTYRVAALGNVTILPALRGKGYGKAVTARLCQHLMQTVDHIGLNVKADNHAAIAAYERLGFVRIAEYEECTLTLKHQP